MAKKPKEDEYEQLDDKAFQKVLHKLCTDEDYRDDVLKHPTLITSLGLTSNQLAILIMIGQETGHYEFKGDHPGACCCCD
jgi:hypothetical protein